MLSTPTGFGFEFRHTELDAIADGPDAARTDGVRGCCSGRMTPSRIEASETLERSQSGSLDHAGSQNFVGNMWATR